MRTLFFLPDDPELKAALEAALAKYPRARRVSGPAGVATEVEAADRKHGFVVLEPPRAAEELEEIDRKCAGRFGRRLPRAVFFAPKTKQDRQKYADYVKAVKPVYERYHRVRRALVFTRLRARELTKTVRLSARTDSLLRWGLLGPMGIFAAAVVLLLFVFRDAIARPAAVQGLQALFGARAEVAGLKSTLSPSVELKGVSVANRNEPMRNLFEFDRMAGGASAGGLLAGRLHVEELALEGLKFGTERSESGALPGAEAEPPEEVPPPPEGGDLDRAFEDILKRLQPPPLEELESVRLARQVEEESRQRLERLDRAAKELPGRLEAIRKRLEGMGKAEVPPEAQEAIKELEALRADLGGLGKARSDLAVASAVGIEEEKKSIEGARAKAEEAKASMSRLEDLVARSKEIKKVGLLDAPKVLKLVEEMRTALKGLDQSAKDLEAAGQSLDQARQSLEKKKNEVDARLRSAQEGIEGAEKLAGGDGAELRKRYAELGERASKAKAAIEAGRGEAMGRLKEVQEELAAVRQEAEGLRGQTAGDLEYFRAQPAALQAALEADRKNLMERYDPAGLNAEEIMRAALGERAAGWIQTAFKAYQVARPYLARKGPPKPKKAKLPGGTVYHFPVPQEAPPRVWIKKLAFTGTQSSKDGPLRIEGRAFHLSSDPAAAGEDPRLEMTLESGERKLVVRARGTAEGEVEVEVEAEGLRLAGGRVGGRKGGIEAAAGSVALKVQGKIGPEGFGAGAKVSLQGLKLRAAEGTDERLGFLNDILAGITALAIELEARWKAGGGTELLCRSAEAADLSGALRGALGKQMEGAKKEALGKLDGMAAEPMAKARAAADSFLAQAPGKSGEIQKLLSGMPAGGVAGGGEAAGIQEALDAAADPDKAVAAFRKDLEALKAERGQAGTRQEAAFGEQQTSAAAASSLLEGETQRLGTVKEGLTAEIDRVLKLTR